MEEKMIAICKNCLDFEAPMITTLSEEIGISKKEAESFISKNLNKIFDY